MTVLISFQSKGLSRVLSNTTVQSINSLALSFLYSPTLTGPKHKLPITSLPSPGRLHLNLPAGIHHLTYPFLPPVPFLEPGQYTMTLIGTLQIMEEISMRASGLAPGSTETCHKFQREEDFWVMFIRKG